MKLFLCGGGDGNQTIEAYKKFNEEINHDKPLLYIPLAMQSDRYDSCYKWITEELKNIDVPRIDMVRSADELVSKNLTDYSALFIGGGNTYKLLKDLKDSGSFEKIKEYMNNDGIIFGGSAGAIIFGECIDTCKYDDTNDVCLQDWMGFNAINNFSILCHFTNRNKEKTETNKKYLQELSHEEKIIALPEEDTIYCDDGKFEVIGNRPYYIFEEGNIIVYNSNSDRANEFFNLTTPSELMNFMNHNITYGWIDKLGASCIIKI